MLTARANIHRSRLPAPGAVVVLPGLTDRALALQRRPGTPSQPRLRRFLVEAYPLCDGAFYRGRYLSWGIHTVILRALDDGARVRVAGHWCEEVLP